MVKGFKGFDQDLTCRGFQYEIGKVYEHKGDVLAKAYAGAKADKKAIRWQNIIKQDFSAQEPLRKLLTDITLTLVQGWKAGLRR